MLCGNSKKEGSVIIKIKEKYFEKLEEEKSDERSLKKAYGPQLSYRYRPKTTYNNI